MSVSFEAHGSHFEAECLVWQPVVDRIEICQWQTVQLVGTDFKYGFAFRFSRLEKTFNLITQYNCSLFAYV